MPPFPSCVDRPQDVDHVHLREDPIGLCIRHFGRHLPAHMAEAIDVFEVIARVPASTLDLYWKWAWEVSCASAAGSTAVGGKPIHRRRSRAAPWVVPVRARMCLSVPYARPFQGRDFVQ